MKRMLEKAVQQAAAGDCQIAARSGSLAVARRHLSRDVEAVGKP